MRILSAVEREVLRQQALEAKRRGRYVTLAPDLVLRIVENLDYAWGDDEPQREDEAQP